VIGATLVRFQPVRAGADLDEDRYIERQGVFHLVLHQCADLGFLAFRHIEHQFVMTGSLSRLVSPISGDTWHCAALKSALECKQVATVCEDHRLR
jgi:hypothetical protein